MVAWLLQLLSYLLLGIPGDILPSLFFLARVSFSHFHLDSCLFFFTFFWACRRAGTDMSA